MRLLAPRGPIQATGNDLEPSDFGLDEVLGERMRAPGELGGVG